MANDNAVLSWRAEEAFSQDPDRAKPFRLDSSSADCSGMTSGASDAGRSSEEPDSRSHSCSTVCAEPAPEDTAPAPAQQLPQSSGSRRRNRRSTSASRPFKQSAAATAAAAVVGDAADPHHAAAPCEDAAQMQQPLAEPTSPCTAAETESPGRAECCNPAATWPASAATPRSVQRRQRGFGGGGGGLGGDQEVLVDLAGEGDLLRATAAVAAALLPPSTLPVRIVVTRPHPREAGLSDPARDGHAATGSRPAMSKAQRADGARDAAVTSGDEAGAERGSDGAAGREPVIEAPDELTQMAATAAAAAAAAAVAKASTISVVRSRTGAGGRSGEGGGQRSSGAGGPGNEDDSGAPPHSPGASGPHGGVYSGAPERHGQTTKAMAVTSAGGDGGSGAADGGGGCGGGKGGVTTSTRRRLLRTAGMLQVAVHPREDLGQVYRAPPVNQPLPCLEPVTSGLPYAGGRGPSHSTTPSGFPAASPGAAPPQSPGTPGNGAALSPGGRRGGSGRPPRSPKPTATSINGASPGGNNTGGGSSNWRAGGGAAGLDRLAPAGHASVLTLYGTGYPSGASGSGGAVQMPCNVYGFVPQPPPPPPRRAALASPQPMGYKCDAFQQSPRSPDGYIFRQDDLQQQQQQLQHHFQQQQRLHLQQHYRDAAALTSPSMLSAAAAAATAGGVSGAMYGRKGRLSGTGGGDAIQLMPRATAVTASQALSGALDPAVWAYLSESPSSEPGLSALRLIATQAAAAQSGGGGADDVAGWSGLLASGAAADGVLSAFGAAALAGARGVGLVGAEGLATRAASTTADAATLAAGVAFGAGPAMASSVRGRRPSSDLPANGDGGASYPKASDYWVGANLQSGQLSVWPEGVAALLQGNASAAAASAAMQEVALAAPAPPCSSICEAAARAASTTAVSANPFAQRLPQGPILATAATGDPTLDVISAVNWSVGPFNGAVRSLSCASGTSALLASPAASATTATITAAACPPARTGPRSSSSSGSNAGSGGSAAPCAALHELPTMRSVSYPTTPQPPPMRSSAMPPGSPPPCPGAFLGLEVSEVPPASPPEYNTASADVAAALAAARQLMPGMALPGGDGGAAVGREAAVAMAAKKGQLQLVPLVYMLGQQQQQQQPAPVGGSDCWQWQAMSSAGTR